MTIMNRTLPLLSLLAAAALASACGSNADKNILAPTSRSADVSASSPTGSGSTTSTQSLIGTWASGPRNSAEGLPASFSQCSSMILSITSQTATLASGTLTMVCPDNISVAGTIVGRLGAATIPLTYNGSATQAGQNCPFTMSGTGTQLGGDTFRFDFTGSSCMGPIYGSETLRLGGPSAAPAPAPGPAPAPAPGPTTTAVDAIHLSQAVIRDSPATLGSWPITTALTVVEMRPNGIHVEFSKQNGAGRWPDWTPPGWDGPLQYSLGMVLSIGGGYYAAAPIQFWNGLEASGGPPSEYALNWFYSPGRWAPMTYHQPAVGETIGIFVCAGDCRGRPDGSGSPVKERSNVVAVTMPSNAGARFTF
jgi:hypothetical protein